MNQADIKKVQDLCYQRMQMIEEVCSYHQDFPQCIISLYSLYHLMMTRRFDKYFESYGLQTINAEDVNEAKRYFDLPKISPLEIDVINILNQMVEGKRRKNNELRQSNVSASNGVRSDDLNLFQRRSESNSTTEAQILPARCG